MISQVEPSGAESPVNYFREDGTVKEWAELTDDEQESLAYSTALDCLDDPGLEKYTAATLREESHPLWHKVAAAMDAEIAVRATRDSLRVARAADE